MPMKNAIAYKAWEAPEARRIYRTMNTSFRRFFQQHGVPETPFLLLHADDVIAAALTAACLEKMLAGFAAAEEPLSQEPRDADMRLRALITVADAAGKARERMRKAMKDLEEYCSRNGVAAGGGIADIMKPILEKANNALQENSREDTKNLPNDSVV